VRKIFLVLTLTLTCIAFSTARIKDIANFRGVRDNQLFGIGIVVGLNGTGDSGKISSTVLSNETTRLHDRRESRTGDKHHL